jgi:putative transcriptional regulator
MKISYKGFFKLLIDKDLTPKKVVDAEVLSRSTMLKLKKGEYVSLEVIENLCAYLNCQPGDLLEYIPADNK